MLSNDSWHLTLPGQMYTYLKGKEVPNLSVVQGVTYEVISSGDEQGTIYKELVDSTVGERGVRFRASGEKWEYHRFSWWKDAIDHFMNPFTLLPYPVSRIAEQLGIKDWDTLFIPSKVIEKYEFKQDPQLISGSILSHIKKILDPLLAPKYHVQTIMNAPRIIPNDDRDPIVDPDLKEILQQVAEKLDDLYMRQKEYDKQHSPQ